MLLHCHSRKCNTTREHKLKVESNEAVCMDCGEINNMVSDFMKSAMHKAGDIYRSIKSKKAFTYKCPKCTVDRGVKIVDELALCESCGQQLNLSVPMIQAIKTTASKNEVESDAETPKEELNKGVIKRRKE